LAERFDILDVHINVTGPSSTVAQLEEWILTRHRAYVCLATVKTITDCHNSPEYLKIINSATMVVPDGMPLVWIGKSIGQKTIERTTGVDLMLKLCHEGQVKNYKHFLYGSTEETIGLLAKNLKNRFGNIQIVGMIAPALLALDAQEDQRILNQIDAAKPDILWVGLGAPKQDYWMANHRDKINVPVMVGVGAAFDFIAGTKPRAPRWMSALGLEWFFRLCCEPRRLWKRYFFSNFQFIYLLLKRWLFPI
jgi:N-acetylglucosaminyldiphosphoundecaprenol N-acetyl-beta-D-mannosaminyltransferase